MKKQEMLSTAQAGEILGVSDQTILNWWKEGLFPHAIKLNPTKRNSPLRIPREDIAKAREAQNKAVALAKK